MLALFTLLLACGSAYAAPHRTRTSTRTVNNCKHDFSYTWDDGPYVWHQDILDEFEGRGNTTFYVNGNNWSCIYNDDNIARVRASFEAGHQIASHTWSHTSLLNLTHAQIDVEIQRLDEALVRIIGVKPKFIRPPYGDINDEVADYIISKHGKTIVMWDADSGDSLGGTAAQSLQFYQDFAKAGPGQPHLALSHEVQKAALTALSQGTVDSLLAAGITLLTTAECLDMEPYEYVGEYGKKDSTWTCDGTWSPPSPTGKPAPSATSTTIDDGDETTTEDDGEEEDRWSSPRTIAPEL